MTTSIAIPDNALTIIETVPLLVLTTSLRTSMATLTQAGMAANSQVRAEAARLGLDPVQASHWIYTGFSGHPDDAFDLDIAVPVQSAITGTPGQSFAVRTIPAFRCAQYTFTGPWRDLGGIYDALFIQFYADDHVYDGRVREIYRVVDLINQEDCVTDIQIGIA